MNLLDQTQSNKSPSEKDNYDTKKAKDFKADWRAWQSLRMNKKGLFQRVRILFWQKLSEASPRAFTNYL